MQVEEDDEDEPDDMAGGGLLDERRRFFQRLIDEEKRCREVAARQRPKPRPNRRPPGAVRPAALSSTSPLPAQVPIGKTSGENAAKIECKRAEKPSSTGSAEMQRPKSAPLVPALPDRVLWQLLDLLDYRQQCKVERVCRRWQRLIRQKQRREIRELIVELVSRFN